MQERPRPERKYKKFLLSPLREGRRGRLCLGLLQSNPISTLAPAGGATWPTDTSAGILNISTLAPAGGATFF